MHRSRSGRIGAVALVAAIAACATTDLKIGDDTTAPTPDGAAFPPTDAERRADAPGGDVDTVDAAAPDDSAVPCPTLSPPAPTFCDGGPVAALYDNGTKCVVGYACAPVTCTQAGGQCVPLTPGSCTNGTVGDANKYSCGGGLGTMCCLP